MATFAWSKSKAVRMLAMVLIFFCLCSRFSYALSTSSSYHSKEEAAPRDSDTIYQSSTDKNDSIIWKYEPRSCAYWYGGSGFRRDFCYPTPKGPQESDTCHWFDRGHCAWNLCSDKDIEFLEDTYGGLTHPRDWGKTKYPKPRPAGAHSAHSNHFGYIIIEGPNALVVSLKVKRDGSPSDLRFLDCHKVKVPDRHTDRQRVGFMCDSSGPESDCDDMMEGGIAGTIVEMPADCASSSTTYAVAHAIDTAADQTAPAHFSGVSNRTVLELTFDYNFGVVKKDAGEAFFRLEYSNTGRYLSD
ncbi:hypothetical protein LTR37_003703 [Vermiconidia calcicola]|uniref:Uncharacterized protein n=1 Tax=Vermiconidia calcicola TaxID=1690605 RepID=A0ACC3NPQ3_9PEZI|nr:hypothetical protein LTR37_003703 [Vermiconidia calcicola]